MIKIKNLSKYYGEIKAVKDISFTVNDGEILGFLGANGAGKTTTLKVITGFLMPTEGNVYVNDLNIVEHPQKIQKQIGYLAELNPLYSEMIVYDFLQFTAQIRGIEGKAFKTAISRVIDQCGLKGVVHRKINACSKGYKQRIGLAAAMIHDPAILLLDEPVSGLDPNQIVEIRELIKELGKEKLVMISSHILQEIQATVDRIVIIHKGEIVADGTSQELMSGFIGNTQLTLEIHEATDASLETFAATNPSVKIAEVETVKENQRLLHLEYAKEKDPRMDIFKFAVENKWVITEMSPHRIELENVFRSLTSEGGSNA